MSRFTYVDRQTTFKINLYYPAVVKGLCVTAGHFFVNMWRHSLHALGMKKGPKGSFTIQYPEEMRPLPTILRSRHRIKVHEDGRPKCTACMLCETVCPDQCIHITPMEHDGSPEEKAPAEFIIRMDRCCFCGFCVEACPKDALHMDTQLMELCSDERVNFTLRLADLLDPKAIPMTGKEFAALDLEKEIPHLHTRNIAKTRPKEVDVAYRDEKLKSMQNSRSV
jgi:NADH-quinone oxidoreductase subunit I